MWASVCVCVCVCVCVYVCVCVCLETVIILYKGNNHSTGEELCCTVIPGWRQVVLESPMRHEQLFPGHLGQSLLCLHVESGSRISHIPIAMGPEFTKRVSSCFHEKSYSVTISGKTQLAQWGATRHIPDEFTSASLLYFCHFQKNVMQQLNSSWT